MADCATPTSRYNYTQAGRHTNKPTTKMVKYEESSPTLTEDVNISLEMQENLEQQRPIVYLHGWRLHMLTVACENPYDHVESTG